MLRPKQLQTALNFLVKPGAKHQFGTKFECSSHGNYFYILIFKLWNFYPPANVYQLAAWVNNFGTQFALVYVLLTN